MLVTGELVAPKGTERRQVAAPESVRESTAAGAARAAVATAAGGAPAAPGGEAQAQPRVLAGDGTTAASLRPGYTMAELCAAGADETVYRCHVGTYDGTFDVSGWSRADARPDEGRAISGRVLTADGVGLAGVALVASPERLAGRQDAPGTLRFWTVTDSLGAYAFTGLPDGEYTVRSQAHGAYPSARVAARAGVDYADLVVSPGVAMTVDGRVVDADGAPLEGVTVLPVLTGQPSVRTGDDGRFGLPVTIKPTVGAFALRFQQPGYHEQTGRFEVPRDGAAGDAAMSVVMYPVDAWTSVRGRVVSDTGKPLAGRTVELRPQVAPRSYTATTDGRGEYAFPMVESPADYRLVVHGGADHADHQQALHVTADMAEVDVVARSYAFGTVTGQLLNLDGEPVPDFELVLRNAGSQQPNALVSTDEDGDFEVPVAPAGQFVVASQSSPAVLVEGLELGIGDKLHLPLVLDLGPHQIRGMVTDASGRPVPASRIVMQWSHEADGITTRTTRRAASDPDGRFAFSGVGPGPHSLRIEAPGLPPVEIDHDVSRQGYDLMVKLN